MTQRTIEISSPFFIREEQLKGPGDLPGMFASNRPLALEIGCGTGHFIIEMATANRHTNFLGIDIYNKGCYKTCKKLERSDLDNVRIMRVEARYLLWHYLSRESLTGVYINCPDPWPKKRHRSRRLVNDRFLKILLHYLEPGADFYFSTDFTDYAEQVAASMDRLDGYENLLSSPWVTDLPGYPSSKYMQRFLERGQPIYFMRFRRRADLALDEMPIPDVQAGFRTRWDKAGNE